MRLWFAQTRLNDHLILCSLQLLLSSIWIRFQVWQIYIHLHIFANCPNFLETKTLPKNSLCRQRGSKLKRKKHTVKYQGFFQVKRTAEFPTNLILNDIQSQCVFSEDMIYYNEEPSNAKANFCTRVILNLSSFFCRLWIGLVDWTWH